MTPNIKADDLLLIEKKAKIKLNGIYLFQFNDDVMVKRVTMQLHDRIFIHSDNGFFPNLYFPRQEIEQLLIGKVVWLGRYTLS